MTRDKNWEDNFNEYDYDDHKAAWVAKQELRQSNSIEWWIYIGIDINRENMAKIGLTSGTLSTRATSTQNPFYTIYCAFKVKEGTNEVQLKQIETAIINRLWKDFTREKHITTGRWTEWFYVSPQLMRVIVHEFLCENFSQFMNCYWCPDRGCVINGWQNTERLHGRLNAPFHVSDISDQPVDFACLTPPGCGADCDCW